MDARFFRKILVLLGILFLTSPMMIQSAIAQEMPAGVIVMWSGSPSDIPSGWTLCDCSNGTPNLRGRFILATYPGQYPGGWGGSWYHHHYVGGTSINTNTVGSHMHTTGYPNDSGFTNVEDDHVDKVKVAMYHYHTTNYDGEHSHSASIPGKNTDDSYYAPPYYALAFIMKLPETHDCANLTVVASYPFPGQGAPAGLAYYKDLYVADRGFGQVVKVKVSSESLKVLATIDLPGDCPDGITGLTHDGKNLWYTNENGGMTCTPQIWNISESGELLSSFVSPAGESVGLTFDGEFLWNSGEMGDDIGRIFKVTTSGSKVAEFASPGNGPRDLAFHGGYLWHIDGKMNNLYKLDTTGNVLATCNLASIGISDPVGLTSDGTDLWLTELGTGMIHQISLGQ